MGQSIRTWKSAKKFLWKYRQIAAMSYVIATALCYVTFPKIGSNPFFYFGHCSPPLWESSLAFMSFSFLKTLFFSPSSKKYLLVSMCRHTQLSFGSQLQSQFTKVFTWAPLWIPLEHGNALLSTMWSFSKFLSKCKGLNHKIGDMNKEAFSISNYPIELSAMKDMLSAVSNMAPTDDIQYWALE